jgi:hypothetical protein
VSDKTIEHASWLSSTGYADHAMLSQRNLRPTEPSRHDRVRSATQRQKGAVDELSNGGSSVLPQRGFAYHRDCQYRITSFGSVCAEHTRDFNWYLDRIFCDHLCDSVTPTMIQGGSNPVRNALRPLIKTSATVRLSLHALTATYLAIIAAPASHSLAGALQIQGRAIRSLSEELNSSNGVQSDAALTATIFLAKCEEVSPYIYLLKRELLVR